MDDFRSGLDKQPFGRLWDKGVLIIGFNRESPAQAAGMKKGDIIVEYGGIGDLTTQILATLTDATKPETRRTRLVFVRDRQEHSVDLPRGRLGISGQDKIRTASPQPTVEQVETAGRLRTIQKIYLAFALLGSLDTSIHLLKSAEMSYVLPCALFATVDFLIYFGLRYRRGWVVTLLLIFAAYSCFASFIGALSPAENLKTLFAKIVVLLLLFFFAYNIMFFSKPRVRALFRDRGTLVFS